MKEFLQADSAPAFPNYRFRHNYCIVRISFFKKYPENVWQNLYLPTKGRLKKKKKKKSAKRMCTILVYRLED